MLYCNRYYFAGITRGRSAQLLIKFIPRDNAYRFNLSSDDSPL